MSAASELVRLLVLMMSPRDSMISDLISRISSSVSRIGAGDNVPAPGAQPGVYGVTARAPARCGRLDGVVAAAYKPSADGAPGERRMTQSNRSLGLDVASRRRFAAALDGTPRRRFAAAL